MSALPGAGAAIVAPKGAALLSFKDLLEQLSLFNDSQEHIIAQFRTENEILQKQLKKETSQQDAISLDDADAIPDIDEGVIRKPRSHDEIVSPPQMCHSLVDTADSDQKVHDIDDISGDELDPTCIEKLHRTETSFYGDECMRLSGMSRMQSNLSLPSKQDELPPGESLKSKRWDVQMHQVWTKALPGEPKRILETRYKHSTIAWESVLTDVQEVDEPATSRWILSPSDWKRVSWDLTSMVLLCYDVVWIPLQAFEPESTNFTDVMDMVCQIFWTLDMAMSLCTAYIGPEGTLEFRHWKIFLQYCKTWLVLDLAVVIPDWVTLIMSLAQGASNGGSATGLLRSLRVVRTARILRLVKLKRILAFIKDRITSEAVFISLNIVKLITQIVLINHFLAALWYLVGGLGRDDGNWIEYYKMKPSQTNLWLRYCVSIHWTLTQFTPASNEIVPQNVVERFFAICMLISGLVLFSSFVSSITNSMSQLRNMSADQSKQFWLLRRYLRDRRVPFELSYKVMRYIEFLLSNEQEHIPESRLSIIQRLSGRLQNELKFVTKYTCLLEHPLYSWAKELSTLTLYNMAGGVFRELHLAHGDPLFGIQDNPLSMFFVRAGNIMYKVAHPLLDASEDAIDLPKDSYLMEIVLWAEWKYLGKSKAQGESEVICIGAEGFSNELQRNQDLYRTLCVYAANFVDHVLEGDYRCAEISSPETAKFSYMALRAKDVVFSGRSKRK
eukprot:TRINITY_DN35532_c0_g1_i1.p1 TRINITY_DN35532_c0_g1~~TRINITY_DN35532_c0_g1_i1.p1  ORF type:complete len:737 (+),score=120.01 TRINITY_DN35532_c0_g1_i1:33-2213(+)